MPKRLRKSFDRHQSFGKVRRMRWGEEQRGSWGSPTKLSLKAAPLAAQGPGVVLLVDFRFFGSETFVYFGYSHDLKGGPSPLPDGGGVEEGFIWLRRAVPPCD